MRHPFHFYISEVISGIAKKPNMTKGSDIALIPQEIPRILGALSQGTVDKNQIYIRNTFWLFLLNHNIAVIM